MPQQCLGNENGSHLSCKMLYTHGKALLFGSRLLCCLSGGSDDHGRATRRELITALKRELPAALVYLQRGNIAPVDLAQAAIGPGMAVYTRFSRVLNAAGRALTVREALALINQVLDLGNSPPPDPRTRSGGRARRRRAGRKTRRQGRIGV